MRLSKRWSKAFSGRKAKNRAHSKNRQGITPFGMLPIDQVLARGTPGNAFACLRRKSTAA
jgi:hypothetical protein